MFRAGLGLAATAAMVFIGILADIVPAIAKVHITERTRYYSVSGSNGPALFKSIKRRGPKHRRTGHAIATTKTDLKVRNIKFAIKGRRCVVESADVVLNITYTYPRWKGSRRASPALRKRWKSFYALVEKHEKTHGRISRDYARRLEKKLKTLSGRVSKRCSDFGRWSRRSLKLIKKSFAQRHRSFDRREGRASSRIRRLQKAMLSKR